MGRSPRPRLRRTSARSKLRGGPGCSRSWAGGAPRTKSGAACSSAAGCWNAGLAGGDLVVAPHRARNGENAFTVTVSAAAFAEVRRVVLHRRDGTDATVDLPGTPSRTMQP
ncbi:MAG: hypothetical protein ABR583_13195 [Gaiellaceae bacterium]